MNRIFARAGLSATLAALAWAGIAQAHITLETRKAPAGSTYKAVFRVPHGCAGSPTKSITVDIPGGMINVKPMPHPGWQLTTRKGKLPSPYVSEHGTTISEGVIEVEWSGGALPDDQYDEFVLRGMLPREPGRMLYFPVIQHCEKGTNNWTAIPEAGKTTHDDSEPAPGLMLTAPAANGR